ncbi:hydroxymethylglutaryl-CoA synthase, partial [Chloroflexota bacterium]
MVGITSYGAYIPHYRLSRGEISKAWGRAVLPGEKAVCSYDEDSLTMAVAAAMDCTMGIDAKGIDGLYFASTTSPYKEKQTAATIAAALNLNEETFTADFSNSLRSGTNAMRVALDAVKGGSAKSVLVCTAENRLGLPDGDAEMAFGDGAAALMIGDTGTIATFEGSYTHFDEFLDVWRSDKDYFVRSWEDRFSLSEGYERVVTETVSAALSKYNLRPQDFAKAVFYAPNPRQLGVVAAKLGFDVKTQVQDTLYNSIGNTGTASVLMSLVAALEEAKAGDRILLVNYSNGCDVFILKITDSIEKFRNRRGIKGYLPAKQMLSSYQKYLRWRNLIQTQPPARPDPTQPSSPALWRDTKGGLALYGAKCRHCGTIQYPAQRVCVECQTKDDFDEYRFSDKTGTIFTFSRDNLAAHPDPPAITAAVDFPEGGRIMCDVTDCGPDEVKVGMPVEMTFRKLDYVGGLYNYWWKCRP